MSSPIGVALQCVLLSMTSFVELSSIDIPLYSLRYAVVLPGQPVLHDWCNKGRCMYYSVCGRVNITYPLLLIEKSSYVVEAAGFLSVSGYLNGFLSCPTPYNRKENVLSASLKKTFPFFFLIIVL